MRVVRACLLALLTCSTQPAEGRISDIAKRIVPPDAAFSPYSNSHLLGITMASVSRQRHAAGKMTRRQSIRPAYLVARLSTGCMGTLISPSRLLTSAHCLYDDNNDQVDLERLQVIMHDPNLTSAMTKSICTTVFCI